MSQDAVGGCEGADDTQALLLNDRARNIFRALFVA